MRNRFVYFTLSLAAALAALVTQVSPPAAAQRASPKEPTAECVACEESCNVAYQACTAELGSRGPGHALCVRERQDCRRACDAGGGPCDKKADPTPDPAPVPTPSPTPTPTPD